MYLGKKKVTDLSAREKDLKARIDKQNIEYFPIERALSIPVETVEEVDVGQKV
jgi:hypothetical protein